MQLLAANEVAIERGERRLLAGVDLSVSSGDIWQLVGANGVGKTSLLRAFGGLTRLGVAGEITCHGTMLYLGHHAALKRNLSALDNLRFHPACDVICADEEIMSALAAVALAGYEDRPIGALSAGQQRRVALARLVLSSASLWLLDEPFTALDVDGCAWLEERIKQHVAAEGAVIFTSHQPSRFGESQQNLDLAAYVV